jgi:hypothetical protein
VHDVIAQNELPAHDQQQWQCSSLTLRHPDSSVSTYISRLPQWFCWSRRCYRQYLAMSDLNELDVIRSNTMKTGENDGVEMSRFLWSALHCMHGWCTGFCGVHCMHGWCIVMYCDVHTACMHCSVHNYDNRPTFQYTVHVLCLTIVRPRTF